MYFGARNSDVMADKAKFVSVWDYKNLGVASLPQGMSSKQVLQHWSTAHACLAEADGFDYTTGSHCFKLPVVQGEDPPFYTRKSRCLRGLSFAGLPGSCAGG